MNMIYPKFPRRTLALILFCLVVTLGAMGILFLVYFFNKGNVLFMDSSLKPIYTDPKQNQLHKQNIFANGNINFEQKSTSQYIQDIDESMNQENISNRSSISQNYGENLPILSSSSSHEFEFNRGKEASFATKTTNYKGLKDSSTNSDTIYIDDFDRPSYNSKRKGGLTNIDYFDTILVDHKHKNKNDLKLGRFRLPEAEPMRSIIIQNNFISEASNIQLKNTNENERKSRINSNRQNENRWNKTKLVRNAKITHREQDDDDVNDIDAIGSGSGDFVDDTEINESFMKRINARMIKKESNLIKSVKKNSIKNSRTQKKHRNYFFNNENQFISSSALTTSSAESDRSVNNWATHKSFNNIVLYPTIPSETLESFSELTSKLWPSPALTPNHKKSNVYESDSYSANLPTLSNHNNFQPQLEIGELSTATTVRVVENDPSNLREIRGNENNESWIETRTRRIMGNVKKSEERSRQLLLCEEAGGGELCRMLFKGHIND